MAEINDYLNSLNEAMAIHAKNAIKNLQFNKTELCTIVNETRAEQNIYIVWNGSSRYEAYSTTDMKYHIDDRVYVNIPNNDFSQKKYIIGPYVDGDAENLLYVSPFSNFTSSEINLINIAEENEGKGLIEFAYDKEGIKKFVKCELALGDKIELIIPKEEIDQLNKGYKYIAISADFMTDFGNEKVISGDYGIEIHADYEKEVETLKDPVTDKKVYTLTKKDMIGDIYNFKTYFTQKALYELEKDDNPIEGITIVLYADDNFKTADLKTLESGKIYIANIEITFGDPSAKNEDVIKIYTNNGNNYDSRAKKSDNQKTIHFKWQDYDDENEITYNYDEENKNKDIKIHWYTDKVHSPGEDTKILTDEVWKNYLDAAEDNKKNLIQDVISYYQLVENKHYIKNDNGEINITSAGEREIDRMIKYSTGENVIVSDTLAGVGWSLIEDNYNKWSITFDPDITKNSCKVKVIITDKNDEKIGESNELEFKNTIQVADPATVAKIAGLKIKADKDGNYPIYSGNTGEILSKSEIKDREMSLELKDPITNESYFTKNEVIIWKIPKTESMIQMNPSFLGDDEKSSTKLKELIPEQLKDSTGTLFNDEGNFYYIYKNNQDETPKQKYRVENFYNKLKTNNTIFAYVIKNNVLYEASKDFTFSQYGTSGSEYTFYLGLGDTFISKGENKWERQSPKSIITLGANGVQHQIVAQLFNAEGQEINTKINLEWVNKPDGLAGFNSIKDKNGEPINNCINSEGDATIENSKGGIIKAEATYAGVKFTQYLAIPVGIEGIAYYDGPDKITYDDTGGSPSQWGKPLRLCNSENKEIDNIIFSISPSTHAFIDTTGKYLKPSPIYYSINPKEIQYEILECSNKFTCPILIIQNKYQIPIINQWDGSYTVDEEEGSVLATMFGAGTKASDGTFTGLLMGQINKPNLTPSVDTGLFGYQGGTQTFRLGVDGKLTLGSSGMGQIEFNGTTGTISGGNGGLIIDLEQGTITSNKQFNLIGPAGSKIYFGDNNNNYIEMGYESGESGKPYLKGIKSGETIFELGEGNNNKIGNIEIRNDGLYSNNDGEYFKISAAGISGLGWSIGNEGIYIDDGYNNSVVTDADEKIRGLKANLLDYIDRRINAGTISKSFNSLLLTPTVVSADVQLQMARFPRIVFEGLIPSNYQNAPKWWQKEIFGDWKAPDSAEDALFDYFAHNFIIKTRAGIEGTTSAGPKNLKDFVWWCIDLWIKENGGSGLDGTSEGVGRGGNAGKHLFRQDEETGLDIIESEQDIQKDIVDHWETSTENNKYSPSMYINNPGPWKNCTWSAWELFLYFTGHELPMWGNAIDWYAKAQADPAYETGLTPPNGKPSILVLRSSENAWGHVAVVIKRYNNEDGTWNKHIDSVEGNYITNSEPGFRLMINNTPLFGRRNKTVEGYIWLKDTNTLPDGEEGD